MLQTQIIVLTVCFLGGVIVKYLPLFKNGTETDYELKTMIGKKKLSNSEWEQFSKDCRKQFRYRDCCTYW